MKKILPILMLASCALLPALAFAQTGLNLAPKCNPALAPGQPGQPGSCNISAAITFIKQIINFMVFIAVPLAALFIVYGGFVMLTSAGNEDKFAKGKQIITAVVIGLAIAFGSYLIVTSILNFFTSGKIF